MNKTDIRVIIPLHAFEDATQDLITKAIESVPREISITVSCSSGLQEKLPVFGDNVTVTADCDSSDFCSLVNAAVEKTSEKWFSILEFDDTFTPIWFDNAIKYAEYLQDVSVFMPLEDIINFNTNEYVNMGNAEAWASSFSNEIGYIDLDCLQNYFDFYLTGSIFNTADWMEVGGLKPLIKITFWYEWLLRATNKGKKVFVIPKIGYNHMLARKDSLTEIYKASVSKEETEWWFDLAKKDYFYKDQKEPSYYTYKTEQAV